MIQKLRLELVYFLLSIFRLPIFSIIKKKLARPKCLIDAFFYCVQSYPTKTFHGFHIFPKLRSPCHGSLEGVGGLKANEAYHSKADVLVIPKMY